MMLLAVGKGSDVVRSVMGKTEAERIAELTPDTQLALRALKARCAARGVKVYVGQTVRDRTEQAAQVAAGRSDNDNSWHLVRRAADCYVIDPTTGKADTKGTRLVDYKVMHEEAKRLGFRGIAFNEDGSKRYIGKGVWDVGHLEFRGGMNWSQALAKLDSTDKKRRGLA